MARVLIVDDEQNMRWVLQEAMTQAGHTSQSVASGPEALALLGHTPIDLVILDLKLKGMDGLATLRQIHTRWPQVVVIILTAYGTVATAVEALQHGAADYLRKPFDIEELMFKIARSLERQHMLQEIGRLRRKPVPPLCGSHPAWRQAVETATQTCSNEMDICLVGEPGCGKATIARSIHATSPRATGRLLELDIATLPLARQAYMLEGTPKQGQFWTQAGQGILVLRHIGSLGAEGQAALMNLRQRREETGVGPLLISTAYPDDWSDPYAVTVEVPALRDHRDDILLLIAERVGDNALMPDVEQLLYHYDWPGNIAELYGIVDHAAIRAHGSTIEIEHLPDHIRSVARPEAQEFCLPPEGVNLDELEASLLRQALRHAQGNKTRAAELLGLTRQTLLYRLDKYHIS